MRPSARSSPQLTILGIITDEYRTAFQLERVPRFEIRGLATDSIAHFLNEGRHGGGRGATADCLVCLTRSDPGLLCRGSGRRRSRASTPPSRGMLTRGQSHIVTCSGAYKGGSLRIVRQGVGLTELANLDMEGIQKIFPLTQGSGYVLLALGEN